MPAGLQVYDTDGTILFNSSVTGVQFLHTIVEGKRVQNTSDIRYVNISDAYHYVLIMEVPVSAPPEIMAQLTPNNTMTFLRTSPLAPTSNGTGQVYVGEYRGGYMRFPLFASEASIKSAIGGTSIGYYATLVWIA